MQVGLGLHWEEDQHHSPPSHGARLPALASLQLTGTSTEDGTEGVQSSIFLSKMGFQTKNYPNHDAIQGSLFEPSTPTPQTAWGTSRFQPLPHQTKNT